MGSHIVEVTASGNFRLKSPRQRCMVTNGLGIGSPKRLRITYLHIEYLTYPTTAHNIINFLEIWQIASIIGHKAGNACLLRDTVDTGTVVVTCRQGFLHIYRLTSLHRHDGISGMTGGRCSHIDGIHVRIINQFLSIGVPFLDTMGDCIGACATFRAAHDCHHTRPFHFAEGRTTFLLRHLTATDESPS